MIYDVIVVGGGIAGLMAAIEAKDNINKVAVLTKGNLFRSNSALASGGINAVLDPNDKNEIQKHINDTYTSTKDLGDMKAVTYMCNQAPHIIKKLVEYGVEFDRNENGEISQRSFGGGSSKRTCYVQDTTGSKIMQVLIKKAKSVGVDFIPNNFAMNLAHYQGKVSGVVSLRRVDSSLVVYPSKSVILAGGGYAGIFRGYSTNAQDCTGDSLAIALRAGLQLKDMEFVQFHPTGFIKTSYLVSEAARGEGGYLINSDNERFVDELQTRDVVSHAISSQMKNGKEVFIDLRHLEKEHIEKKLPSLLKNAYYQAGIDITKELLPIKPVAHYSMGGIESQMTATHLKGLYVCGECSAIGVHGANRLGGNSLLEGSVFGVLAGQNARVYSQKKEFLPIDYNIVVHDQKRIDTIFDGDTTKNFNAMRITLGKTLFELAGINRDKKSLRKCYNYLKYLRREARTLHCIDKGRNNNVELVSILELRNALEVAETVVLSASKRKESRGAHNREDFPQSDSKYQKSILVKEMGKNYFKLSFEDNSFFGSIKRWLINT